MRRYVHAYMLKFNNKYENTYQRKPKGQPILTFQTNAKQIKTNTNKIK